MNTIKEYIITLNTENVQVSKIKITNHYNFNDTTFFIDSLNKTIQVEKAILELDSLVEFYNDNNEVIAKAVAFNSVL